ncbi:hypothetical protein CHLNCDRAFT_137863 [Chlorella variabilis]|uniref:Ribokinase n=1 Tax=Chlorella variabilis TaxID=554065 RepID=E1Z4P3_CHLVA|nr:hypothetical protein CHLNCDRAFT_137863 [Chlorella variabilis]EFN59383.1 hypothetical protein CHLNCDRAFT_137863 [Chlorella variabilis]|eukprot:XP_005851485.1 hypothetical protein CHLNCDRAFT_137863 [Chlorella variabilis]
MSGRRPATAQLLLAMALCCLARAACAAQPPSILTVGSLNLDVIVAVDRMPTGGETIMARSPAATTAVGGKGANQAVAAARLSAGSGRASKFVCQFGNDSHAAAMEAALVAEGVDVSLSGHVLLEPDGGATSIVLGGSNTAFPREAPEALAHLMEGTGVVMLQREVPEHVNEAVAAAAAKAGVPVLLDVGGEDRPISDDLLPLLDYVCPNESELARLTGLPTASEAQVLAAAAALQRRGARSVLVTLGPRGSLLAAPDGSVLRQEALGLPGAAVVDATAAGDAFRAAFAVALVEGRPLRECLRFASAAGGIATSRMGAVPSLPGRQETEQLAASSGSGGGGGSDRSGGETAGAATGAAARPVAAGGAAACGVGTCASKPTLGPAAMPAAMPQDCPHQFAARLNSMSARRDLAGPTDGADDVLGWLQRQARIPGLSLVAFNHPQHTAGHTPAQLRAALAAAGLGAAAVALRFPEDYALGAFTSPDPQLRRAAVALAAEGCRWAAELGAPDLIVDYPAAWQHAVAGYRQLADACRPGVRVSLEFKATDEATRWSLVPSTGAALLLAGQVDRSNFGLTLDVGHLLMAGESPAQSVALAGAAGKLFGLHLNDAHVKLGAEDGLAFGSVGGSGALELVRWLHRVNYSGTIYFDTFPRKEDPVREAAYNIRRFRQLWARAARLVAAGLDGFAERHDALGALELLAADEERGAVAPMRT